MKQAIPKEVEIAEKHERHMHKAPQQRAVSRRAAVGAHKYRRCSGPLEEQAVELATEMLGAGELPHEIAECSHLRMPAVSPPPVDANVVVAQLRLGSKGLHRFPDHLPKRKASALLSEQDREGGREMQILTRHI